MTGDLCIPLSKASDAENFSIWWRHRDLCENFAERNGRAALTYHVLFKTNMIWMARCDRNPTGKIFVHLITEKLNQHWSGVPALYLKTFSSHQMAYPHQGSNRWAMDIFKEFLGAIQYIPRNMHTVFALLCFVVVIHWLIFPYPPGLLHWHCGNLTIAPVPAKQPWWIWINTSCEFIMNDCITTTKQSTTKPCAYFLGYTVYRD